MILCLEAQILIKRGLATAAAAAAEFVKAKVGFGSVGLSLVDQSVEVGTLR